MVTLSGIYGNIIQFVQLTFEPEVLLNIIPLAIATVAILLYFERYKDENPGWNTYFSNSLVLLFVSINLVRGIYNLDGYGALNFIIHQDKGIAVVFLALIGMILMRFNFEHLLPEKIAKYLSSIMTINLLAFGVVLFVYTPKQATWEVIISLIIIVAFLSIFLNLMRLPAKKIFKYVEKEKEKERLKDVKEQKYQVEELKEKLKRMERQLTKNKVKELDKQKKEAIKLKKVIKK